MKRNFNLKYQSYKLKQVLQFQRSNSKFYFKFANKFPRELQKEYLETIHWINIRLNLKFHLR